MTFHGASSPDSLIVRSLLPLFVHRLRSQINPFCLTSAPWRVQCQFPPATLTSPSPRPPSAPAPSRTARPAPPDTAPPAQCPPAAQTCSSVSASPLPSSSPPSTPPSCTSPQTPARSRSP